MKKKRKTREDLKGLRKDPPISDELNKLVKKYRRSEDYKRFRARYGGPQQA